MLQDYGIAVVIATAGIDFVFQIYAWPGMAGLTQGIPAIVRLLATIQYNSHTQTQPY